MRRFEPLSDLRIPVLFSFEGVFGFGFGFALVLAVLPVGDLGGAIVTGL
jgi:hypothetical protein